MSKKTSPCILSVEAAGELLGLDAQTVRICIRAGHFGDFARAIKSKPTNECYLYIISKFKLYQYLGLDVNLSTEETLELVRQGKPPFIEQTSYPIKDLLSEMTPCFLYIVIQRYPDILYSFTSDEIRRLY